jgi:hypothetical protein
MPSKIRQSEIRKKKICFEREQDPPDRPAPQKQTGSDLLLPSDAAAFLSLSEVSLFWLWQFGCRSDDFASPLPAVYNSANEARFRRAVLDAFKERVALDPKLGKIVAEAESSVDPHRPFWHRAAEKLTALRARAPKSRGDRDAAYRYFKSVYEALLSLKEQTDEETTDHHYVRSLFAELLRRTSTLWAWGEATTSDARGDACAAGFFAGVHLLALDQILRSGEASAEAYYAGVLRQRLALKSAASCARLARLREDETAIRDAEHLSVGGAFEATTPGGRLHRLWRLLATRPARFNAPTLQSAQALLGLPGGDSTQGLADALSEIVATATHPLAAAASVSLAASRHFDDANPNDAEMISLWLADAALAQKLGWRSAVPLIATAIAHPALRKDRGGRRPRPGDPDWCYALALAYALSAQQAYDIAADLSRRAQKLLIIAPKLRAKGAERVIELLLADDCVAAARAAKQARLSDRATRRLFDRLIEFGPVRELSGRPSFRLYGL